MLCRRCAIAVNIAHIRAYSTARISRHGVLPRWASTSTSISITDPIVIYHSLVQGGRIQHDENQLRLLYQLRKVHDTLMDYTPSYSLRHLLESSRPERKSGSSSSSLSDHAYDSPPARILPTRASKSLVQALTHEDDLSNLDSPEGFLLTGSVGTGKTMLLDLFYDSLPIKKKRIHYHAFLLSLYRQVFIALEQQRVAADDEEREMQAMAGLDGRGYPWSRREENKAKALTRGWRQVFAGGRSYDDPSLVKEYVLARIALDLIDEATVLAFDEVQLVDIAGAGILRRVLTWYWRLGGVVIGTSNRLPSDLYQQGVQREQFKAFLDHLQTRCPVYELRCQEDWRRRQRTSPLWEKSLDQIPAWASQLAVDATWFRDNGDFEALAQSTAEARGGSEKILKVYGRNLRIPWQIEGHVARFTFAELCEKAVGPADYLSITSSYPTIIISDIPQLKLTAKNEARRFITFLDAAYESRTRLICHAASSPDEIFFPDAEEALRAAKEAGGDSGIDGDNPLAQDMIGEVMQDLEAPFRPNISSYTSTAVKENMEAAIKDAQTTSPAFRNLAIFTGQDEQFAYKRALSRIFELTSKEFLQSAVHSPIPAEARVWEHSQPSISSSNRLSSTTSSNAHYASTNTQSNTATEMYETEEALVSPIPKGTKIDPLNPKIDITELPKPKIASTHIWGIVDTWGKKAGRWGLGVEAKKQEHAARLQLMKKEAEEEGEEEIAAKAKKA